jgi:hypothetical protein
MIFKQFIFYVALLGIVNNIKGQVLYNPQTLYDAPGGVFDRSLLRSIDLVFEDPNFHNVLVNSFFNAPSYRIPASLTYNGETYDSVGVRYKGNSTFCLPTDQGNRKVPYNIELNHFIDGQKLENLKKIKLANAWMDPTFAKEITAASIYRKYLPSPEVNLLRLNVQGNYLGIYVNTESIDKQFLQKHFGEKNGVFFKCDPVQVFCGENTANGNPDLRWLGEDSASYYNSYDLKSDSGWGALMELIEKINFDFDNLGEVLNIDRTLWAFAVNSAILNLDTYNGYYVHNYYLYQTEDGLFQMIPWDFDNAFAGAILGWEFFEPEVVHNYDTYGNQYFPNERPLLQKLLNDPLRKKQYNAHLRTILTETLLDTATIRNDINELHNLSYSAVQSDFNKAFSMQQFSSNVEEDLWTGWGFGGIMSMVDARNDYLANLTAMIVPTPEISNMSLNNGVLTVDVALASQVDVMATTSDFNSKFEAFQMYDDGTNGDLIANDNTYTAFLPYVVSGDAVKFYIRAQNSSNMSLLPERAEYEFFIYDPNASIEDHLYDEGISVYPNPASAILNIRGTEVKKYHCELYSMVGEKVLEQDFWGASASLFISNIKAGAYILKVNNQTFKVLKK